VLFRSGGFALGFEYADWLISDIVAA
jgi:hypothetical protein